MQKQELLQKVDLPLNQKGTRLLPIASCLVQYQLSDQTSDRNGGFVIAVQMIGPSRPVSAFSSDHLWPCEFRMLPVIREKSVTLITIYIVLLCYRSPQTNKQTSSSGWENSGHDKRGLFLDPFIPQTKECFIFP